MSGRIEHKNLYEEVLRITSYYLGPASKRFIDRQITNHLRKTPDQLVAPDVAVLIRWSTIAMALLTSNDKLVHEFARRLDTLTKDF